MELLPGLARKLSFPVLVLSMIGWAIFVAGFAQFIHSEGYEQRQEVNEILKTLPVGDLSNDAAFPDLRAGVYYFPHWCVIVTGPVLFLVVIIDLVFARWFTGVVSNFVVAVYLVTAGGVVYYDAVVGFNQSEFFKNYVTDEASDLYFGTEWIGCLITTTFLILHMVLWTLFSEPRKDAST